MQHEGSRHSQGFGCGRWRNAGVKGDGPVPGSGARQTVFLFSKIVGGRRESPCTIVLGVRCPVLLPSPGKGEPCFHYQACHLAPAPSASDTQRPHCHKDALSSGHGFEVNLTVNLLKLREEKSADVVKGD